MMLTGGRSSADVPLPPLSRPLTPVQPAAPRVASAPAARKRPLRASGRSGNVAGLAGRTGSRFLRGRGSPSASSSPGRRRRADDRRSRRRSSVRWPWACASGSRSRRARGRSAWSSRATTPGCRAATRRNSRAGPRPARSAARRGADVLAQVVHPQRIVDAPALGHRRVEEGGAVLGDVLRDVAVALLDPQQRVGQPLRKHLPAGLGVGGLLLQHRASAHRPRGLVVRASRCACSS